jgi:GNAT superfamily N-acetyltransferase
VEGVRPAVEADIPRLVELARSFRAEAGTEKGGAIWLLAEAAVGREEHVIRQHLEEPGSALLMGLIDEVDVGYALIAAEGDLAVVHDLFVEPSARSVGVGAALLDAATAWAQERGCTGIDAFALPGARETKNFFEAHGLVTRLLTVHRDLP